MSTIAQVLIVAGVVSWDALVAYAVWQLSIPPWRRPPKVPKVHKARLTFDRDEYGAVVNYENE